MMNMTNNLNFHYGYKHLSEFNCSHNITIKTYKTFKSSIILIIDNIIKFIKGYINILFFENIIKRIITYFIKDAYQKEKHIDMNEYEEYKNKRNLIIHTYIESAKKYDINYNKPLHTSSIDNFVSRYINNNEAYPNIIESCDSYNLHEFIHKNRIIQWIITSSINTNTYYILYYNTEINRISFNEYQIKLNIMLTDIIYTPIDNKSIIIDISENCRNFISMNNPMTNDTNDTNNSNNLDDINNSIDL